MKKLFKIVVPVFSFIVLLFTLSNFNVFAESVIAVASTEFEVHQGETFTTTIYIPDGANIVDFDMTLKYDTDKLTLDSINESDDIKGTVIFNDTEKGKIVNINTNSVLDITSGEVTSFNKEQ